MRTHSVLTTFVSGLGLAILSTFAGCACSSSGDASVTVGPGDDGGNGDGGPKDPTNPSGKAHPRLWLDAPTLATLSSKVGDASSATARAIKKCQAVVDKPSDYAKAESQGDTWAFAAATCGLAYQVTKKPEFAAAGLTMFKALLDDYHTIGDAAGGDDVVTHDTGYAMRFFGPYSALAYDWLHDAPGVSDVLPHARERFEAWVDWYDQKGYLNDQPDSNYHAGYVFAKTLISIAIAGEDGPKGDQYFTDVSNKIFKQDIIAKGLGPGGVLRGGDWAEGWQYGPLSVLEYSLAARSLVELGANYPEITEWERELAVRMYYGLVPDRSGAFSGGDIDDVDHIYIPEPARIPLAVILGPSSDDAASWANHLRKTVANDTDSCAAFDALAEARTVGDVDFATTKPPPVYLATGPGNVYMRSDWNPTATWALFTASPHVVPDHQNHDSSNFAFSRGADHLIVDPTPYGSRSTLTGNALTVESAVDKAEYRPSQTPFSKASLAYARTTTTGVVATRADIAHAFDFSSTASDVPFALRDWVYLPVGEVVVIDRVRTDDAARSGLMRFRTMGSLASAGTDLFSSTVGGSKLFIHNVARSGDAATTRHVDNKVPDCDSFSSNFGACDTARIAVDEYAMKLPGPSGYAIHVLDGVGSGDNASTVQKITDPAALGAIVTRGSDTTAVLVSSAKDGAAGATFAYTLPGAGTVRHVVFDAPEDAGGKSNVTAHSDGSGNCVVSITAGGNFNGHPLIFSLAGAASGCTPTDETPAKMGNE